MRPLFDMEISYIISIGIYLLLSSTVKLWTFEKGRAYLDSHPDFFNRHSIPFYLLSWMSFWGSGLLGVLSSFNPWLISGVAIISYKVSNFIAAYRMAKKHPYAIF